MNYKGNLDNHIKSVEGKTEAAYQTIIFLANDRNFKGIEMDTIWRLIETCIIPITTYGAETWDPNKEQMKKINKILDSIIKRILMTPTGTPRENLYIETGLVDPQTWMIIKKTRHLRKEMTKTEKTCTNKIWIERTKERATQIGIDPEQANTMTRNKWEHWCKAKAIEDIRNRMRETGAHKSKTNFLINRTDPENHERAKYMTKMTRTETSILFAARNRMLKVKDNYKNQYRNSTCRGCGQRKKYNNT